MGRLGNGFKTGKPHRKKGPSGENTLSFAARSSLKPLDWRCLQQFTSISELLEEGGRGINAVYTSSANNGIYSLTPPTIASSYIGFMETHLLLVILLTSLLT